MFLDEDCLLESLGIEWILSNIEGFIRVQLQQR